MAGLNRAKLIEELGFSAFDSLHLASAEAGTADLFLTTDDDLVGWASCLTGLLNVRIENSVSWYEEAQI